MPPPLADRRLRRLIRWLTLLSILFGILSTLIYSSGAHVVFRYLNPPVGAWWDSYQFAIMEISASMLGLLMSMRIGSRLVESGRLRRRSKKFSLLLIVVIAFPLSMVVAKLARLGWTADDPLIRDYLQAFGGYGVGFILDKIIIGSVYFLKSTGFAMLAGFALYAIVVVIVMIISRNEIVLEEARGSIG